MRRSGPTMPKKARETPAVARLNLIVANELAADIKTRLAALQRAGIYCSVSMFFEIAAQELLDRRDLAEVMQRHKATARRERG